MGLRVGIYRFEKSGGIADEIIQLTIIQFKTVDGEINENHENQNGQADFRLQHII